MKAIVLKEQGGVENFTFESVTVPAIKDDEVLIKVKAVSINPADAIVRENKSVSWIFGEESPLILGWDVSGQIVQIGAKVTDMQIGDDVFGVLKHPYIGRTYAEYVAAPNSQLAIKPKNSTYEEAAAASLAALTALQPINKVGIKKNDRVFITAAGGGVGHFAVQFAKYFGAHVIALASGSKKDFLMNLGADEFIDYQLGPFENIMKKDIDLAIEAVKKDGHIMRSMEIVKPGGSLISLWSNITQEENLKAKSLYINAFYNMVSFNGQDMKFVAKLLEEGKLVPHIAKVFSWRDIAKAHFEIEKGHTQGKIVIVMD
ncbi:NADP-dependent oxidoreductase [Flavobacterium sp. ASV13]|uniref:NADP-dependent oxidoreductase n=1 Tax=Flavobacterium sp. ASV13 TaxID=1506583 RepID=UPI0005521615|nr:NADP-dependent oxidoreductase [Flavobacterium sp. ASV13]